MSCAENVIEPPPPVSEPTNLEVVVLSPTSVRLSWTGVTDVSYSVYRDDLKLGDVEETEFVDSTIADNTTYTWFVVASSDDGRLSKPSEPVTLRFGDLSAPTIAATSVANGATNVSRLPMPAVTFSEAMVPASVNISSMVVTLTTSGERVYGSVSYSQQTRTADFWPFGILPARTSVTVTVTSGAKDLAGKGLVAPFSFTFTTGDNPASASSLPPSSQPLLISHRPAEFRPPYDVYKASLDGSVLTNLTNHPDTDRDAAWSPDGRHVAFSSDRDGTYDIYVMRDDGTGLQQLTSGDRDQTSPRWASDAKRIVFSSSKGGVPPISGFGGTPFDIWAMNPDGSAQENLTNTPSVYEFWPHWSPDMSKLLFTRLEFLIGAAGQFVGERRAIMIANANATGAAPLHAPDTAYNDDVASWSPDGSRVAFSVNKPILEANAERWLLFSVRPDGSDLKPITTTGSRRHPTWSPDGTELLVSASGFNEFWGRFGQIAVIRINLETLGETTVVSHYPRGAEVMSPQAWRR